MIAPTAATTPTASAPDAGPALPLAAAFRRVLDARAAASRADAAWERCITKAEEDATFPGWVAAQKHAGTTLAAFVDLIGQAAGVLLVAPSDTDATQSKWDHRPIVQVREANTLYLLVLADAEGIGTIGPKVCDWAYRPIVVDLD